jgi:ribonuclease-3
VTHPSFVEDRALSYERLEFLGDSVLELAVAQALFEAFPEFPEGRLTKIRANVVSRSSCAVVGRKLDLGTRLVERGQGMAPAEDLARLSGNRNVISALLEAALGACYLTYGFERIRAPVVDAFAERIDYALTTHVDYKTELQEELAKLGYTVVYTVLATDGPPHQRSFTTAAVVGGEEWGSGTGASKKGAEQAAAKQALERAVPAHRRRQA